jgi:hypothetical protein
MPYAAVIAKSLFCTSKGDILLGFPDEKTAKVWRERLQVPTLLALLVQTYK